MCSVLSKSNSTDALKFVKTTRSFMTALDDFSNHQLDARIPGLVEKAEAWARLGDMGQLFRLPDIDPRMHSDYRLIISKIAQHRTAARRLHRKARLCPCLRRARVVSVRLKPETFVQTETTGHTASLLKTLHRGSKLKPQVPIDTLCRFTGNTTATAEKDFASTTRKSLEKHSRIHAEVQILAHLRSYPAPKALESRVVQSNKKACFLCSRLLGLTGVGYLRFQKARVDSWLKIVYASNDEATADQIE